MTSARSDKAMDMSVGDRLQLLEAVAGGHTDLLFVRNSAGVFLYCSTSAADLFGCTIDEIVGRSDEDVFGSETSGRIRAQDLRVVVAKTTLKEEHAIQLGERRLLLEVSSFPYRDAEGCLAGVVSIARDITTRRTAEDLIHESEQRYRSLVAAMAEGIVFQAASGEIIACNRQAERILGLTADQICGRTSMDPRWRAIHEDGSSFPGDLHPAMTTLRTGQALSGVVMGIHKPNGTLTWIQINSEPLYREHESMPYAVACSFSDITDRKAAEDALKESQRRLTEAQEIARIGSWVWIPSTGHVWWSDTIYTLFGLTPGVDVPAFAEFLSLLHPDDQPRATARVEAMLQGADEFADDLRLIRPDGKMVWLHSRARATRNPRGEILRVEGTDQDVTARKLAEQVIEDRERTFRELADAIPQIVWVAGPDGGLLDLNAKATEYTGVRKDQLTGWHWGEVIHPEDLPGTLEKWRKILRDGIPVSMEFRIRQIDGHYRWHIARQVPSYDSSGRIACWYGTCTDIEDLKLAEATLQNERTLLRTLIDSIPDLVYTKDVHGRFQLCNKALLSFVGVESEEKLQGKTAFDLFPHEYAIESERDDQRVIVDGETILDREELVRNVSGKDNWRAVIKAPLKSHNGTSIGLVAISQDIQKRKEREQALAASKERLQLALSAATMGTWDWDVSQNRLFRSAEFAAISGLDDPSGNPAAFLRMVHPEDLNHLTETMQRAMRERTRMELEFRIIRPDGSIRWVSEIGTTLYDSQLNPVRMIGIIQDITERKAAEKALRLTQFSIDRAVDSVFWINEAAEILYVNDAACETLGYTREELIGATIPDIDPHFRRDHWPDHWKELKRCGSLTFESVHRTKSGRDLCTEVTANFLRYEGQEYNCAIMRDITRRKRLEEERDRLWNHATDPLAIAGYDGIFKQVNPAWTRILGWSEEELRNRPWLEFVHPDDYSATIAAGKRLVAGESVMGFQNRYRCKDGQYRWFSWNSIPFRETQTMFGFIRDVTEEKLLEEQLRQSQKMEAIGRLAGGVAHDFNNLLTVINGYSEMLLSEMTTDGLLRSCLSSIRSAGERAAELTAQLLAFSRKAIVEPKILDLNHVIESTSQMLRRLIGEDIELIVISAARNGYIKADPGQLERVIMNLTVNARDAMPSGGRLTIETSNVVLDPDEIDSCSDLTAGSYVKLLVSDTGHGISEHLQCKIFEPFFTTKGAGKGTGLGLAVVHGVMKQCGGHIAVSSIEDRGTTFDLLFPVAKEVVSQSTPAPARLELPATETVLLVEDNDSVRNIARIALHAHGFNVIEAESAASALSLVDNCSSPIHLVISDVVMPHMGGQQLAAILRVRFPGLPVLYISGHSDLALHTDEPGSRQEAFLQKPFTPTSLVRKVRSILMKSDSRPGDH